MPSMSAYSPVDKSELELRSFTPTGRLSLSIEADTPLYTSLSYSGRGTDIGFAAPDHRPSHSSSNKPLNPMKVEAITPKHRRHSFLDSSLDLLLVLVLPLIAIAYLAFCYSVHDRVVPLTTYGLYKITPQHLAAIKGGITSISIIIVTLALYPVTDILQQLKSEEFFRTLQRSNHGVPLPILNNISSPSFGQLQALKAVIGRHCSPYFTAAVVAGFLVMAVSTLAPAALNIQTVLFDADIMAFAVGAVPAQSVWNMTSIMGPVWGSHATIQSDRASAVLWAEMDLGVQYSFSASNASDPNTAYVVPPPMELSTSTSARWLSDVITLQPSCTWAQTNMSQVNVPTNFSTASFNATYGVNLVDLGLDLKLGLSILPVADITYIDVMDPTIYVFNHTTQAPPTDGSTTWVLAQCMSGCKLYPTIQNYIWLNFTNIPTASLVFTDMTWDFAFLSCKPNAGIETREIRNDGHGMLSVQPLKEGQVLTRQGNLHPVQTSSMFTVALMSFSSGAGPRPTTSIGSVGSNSQLDFIFGVQQVASLPSNPQITNFTALPLANLAQTYTQMIQSAAKVYTSGVLGTSYVPGRLSTPTVVFTSSLPHVIVSTLLFAVLSAIALWSHFRAGKGHGFNLVNVAAAVHGSELPSQFTQLKNELPDEPSSKSDDKTEEDIVRLMRNRRIFIQKEDDGNSVLHAS